jgi:pimeloyl-ACP methyl ester carboxylesterase
MLRIDGDKVTYRVTLRSNKIDDLQRRLESVETLDRPTLMIQGCSDFCDEPATSEGMDRFFSAPCRRLLLNDVGHFSPREAPATVSEAILAHLEQTSFVG